MKPLYATLEDRMWGRAQREMTDEEKKDMQFYCGGLARYVGQKNTHGAFALGELSLTYLLSGEKKR